MLWHMGTRIVTIRASVALAGAVAAITLPAILVGVLASEQPAPTGVVATTGTPMPEPARMPARLAGTP